MATLNKRIAEDIQATGSFSFTVPDTQRMNNFVVEMIMSGITYPAAENDASLSIQDGEIDPDSGDATDFETVDGGFVLVAGGETRVKIRIVDLATKNVKIVYAPNSVSAGTIESITITFQSS